MHEGRRDELDFLPRQHEILSEGRLCEYRGQTSKRAS
jgi:hypothetical protein